MEIEQLGPAAQEQVRKELARRKRAQAAQENARRARQSIQPPKMGSKLEQDYYTAYIWPRMLAGEISSCERQKRFDLLPTSEYCGLHLPAAHYTPDFLITYTNGQVEAVEVKARKIRQLQRDYIYRRRLFIEIIARPRGWVFTEYIPEE